MKKFNLIIKDVLGVHARLAALLAGEIQKYNSEVILISNEKCARSSDLIAVMGLGIQCGDRISIEISGIDEALAYDELKHFFEQKF